MQVETEKQEYVDPKLQYLNKLVDMVDEANWNVIGGSCSSANKIVAQILSSIVIDGDNTEKLLELQDHAVYRYDDFIAKATDNEVRTRLFLTVQYLNRTYFKDFRSAKPLQKKASYKNA